MDPSNPQYMSELCDQPLDDLLNLPEGYDPSQLQETVCSANFTQLWLELNRLMNINTLMQQVTPFSFQ